MFFKTDYVLGYKASTDKYKKTEITSCISAEHKRINLEIKSKRKYSNT
jgi:hypothetical protein